MASQNAPTDFQAAGAFCISDLLEGAMHLAVRFLGLDLLDITLETDAAEYDEPGDCTTTAFGFQPSPGDQRWEPGTDLGE